MIILDSIDGKWAVRVEQIVQLLELNPDTNVFYRYSKEDKLQMKTVTNSIEGIVKLIHQEEKYVW